MPTKPPGDDTPSGGGGDLAASGKGLLQSLSEGVRNLLVLDEKLVALGREGDRARADVRALQEAVYRLLGKMEEMDKRLGERFAELDKRLGEMDKRIDVQIELAVRKEFERRER
jgi:hypothetical protein